MKGRVVFQGRTLQCKAPQRSIYMSKELNIPCVDCEMELTESFVERPDKAIPPQENYLAKLRQFWRLAGQDERAQFLDWIRHQDRQR
jgi:hypothetical protein